MNNLFNNKKSLAITGALALTLCSGVTLLSVSAHNKNANLATNNSLAKAGIEATTTTDVTSTDETVATTDVTTSNETIATTTETNTSDETVATTTETNTSDKTVTTTTDTNTSDKAVATTTETNTSDNTVTASGDQSKNETSNTNDTDANATITKTINDVEEAKDYLNDPSISARYREMLELYEAEIKDIPASSYLKNTDNVKTAIFADSKNPETGDFVIIFLKEELSSKADFQKYLSNKITIQEFFDTDGGFDLGNDQYHEYFNGKNYDGIADYYRDDNAIILLTSSDNLDF